LHVTGSASPFSTWEWLDKAVSLHGAHIRGAHLRLPGYTDGPTLEIFQYDDEEWAKPVTPNMPGYGHIAFSVSDVKATADKVVEQGGSWVGELTRVEIKGVGTLEFAYMRDPEGNIIEIQKHGD
jgi:catechol 2,3-dioxygenase-like lactoylglutathione lyase family enzyme